MNSQFLNNIISICAIVFGTGVIFFALSDLLIRIAIACLGIWFINYGLRLRGMRATSMFTSYMFRRQNWFDNFYR